MASLTNVVPPPHGLEHKLQVQLHHVHEARRVLADVERHAEALANDLEDIRAAIVHVQKYAVDMRERAQRVEFENGELKRELARRAALTDVKPSAAVRNVRPPGARNQLTKRAVE
jgi:hypothetical protein